MCITRIIVHKILVGGMLIRVYVTNKLVQSFWFSRIPQNHAWGLCLCLQCLYSATNYVNNILGCSADSMANLAKNVSLSFGFITWSNSKTETHTLRKHHCRKYCASIWNIQGAVSIRKTVLPGMVIPMLKIRRPNDRLIFNMEIAIRR